MSNVINATTMMRKEQKDHHKTNSAYKITAFDLFQTDSVFEWGPFDIHYDTDLPAERRQESKPNTGTRYCIRSHAAGPIYSGKCIAICLRC